MTLGDAVQLNETLTSIENILFELRTGYKLDIIRQSARKHYESFQRERTKFLREKRLKDIPDDYREGIDYVFLTIDRVYKVPLSIEAFESFSEQIEKLLGTNVEVDEQSFSVSEFEIGIEETDESGRRRKTKKNILTPALIKVLKPYITDIETLKHP